MNLTSFATRQRAAKGNAWVEAYTTLPGGVYLTGKVLREEITDLPEGGTLHTVAVRWVGRGIAVYAVRGVASFANHDSWTVLTLHEAL